MPLEHKVPAVLLPGSVLPAELAYGALIDALGDDVDARAKDLEVYGGDVVPPPGYSLETEVEGIDRFADEAGFDTFHLVGYSGGGASALAFASGRPERLRSLTLMEPAWAGVTGRALAEVAVYERFQAIGRLPPDQMMPAFIRANLAPGIEPPPPPSGPAPPWMATRPAGIAAFLAAFDDFEPDWERLRTFDRPVCFVLGTLSNPDLYELMAERLARIFRDFTLEVFEERHHFDPPHRVEPVRLARTLRALWARADGVSDRADDGLGRADSHRVRTT